MSNGKLQIVVGGQFGSEAKGHVAKRLLMVELAAGRQAAVVRVGGPNAGHTVLDASGVAWALRQVPVGAVVPETQLVIGAGSEIDMDVLISEVRRLEEAGHSIGSRLWVDAEATILESAHKDTEGALNLQSRLGSTGKGIGAARADRVLRKANTLMGTPRAINWLNDAGIRVVNSTGRMLTQQMMRDDWSVIIEGTQGYGLGLHAGYYPYCTSGDCRAIDFAAQAGVMPWNASEFEAWVVVRPYPIRVAGNSGPLVGETTWEELGLPPEYTTVTKKIRRVGRWDYGVVRDAIMANGGHDCVKIAFTMADQVVPGIAGLDQAQIDKAEWRTDDLLHCISTIEACGAPVSLVTTGPDSGFFV